MAVFSFLPSKDKYSWDTPSCSDEELRDSAKILAVYHSTIYNWKGIDRWRERSNLDEINLMATKWKGYAQKTVESSFDQYFLEQFDDLVKTFQKDAAVMSQEQQVSARQKLASKQSDLEHVSGKLQQVEQAAGQQLLQEMSPMVQEVLRELISTEGIGLLLQRASVIHADAGYSITAKVTDKLNQATAE